MGTGNHALSSAGPEAAYWAISAYNGEQQIPLAFME